MKLLYFSSHSWNFFKGRAQDLILALANFEHYQCTYIEPIKYRNASSERLRDLVNNPTEGLSIIQRQLKYCGKGAIQYLYENTQNCLIIIRNHPDVVISNDQYMSLFPCLFCWFTRKRFVFDYIDNWVEFESKPILRWLVGHVSLPLLFRFSFAVTCTSHFLQEQAAKHTSNAHFVPNGYYTTQQFPLDDRSKTRLEVNFVSTLGDWVDVDLLVNVFKQLPHIALNIYGSGKMETHLKRQSKNIGNIRYCGIINHNKAIKKINQSLFGIIPFKVNKLNKGTLPVKLFDYWANKKAVISTPIPEVLIAGGNCCLFASTEKEWIKQINYLLSNKTKKTSLEIESYKKVVQMYNYKNIAQKFDAILRSNNNQ